MILIRDWRQIIRCVAFFGIFLIVFQFVTDVLQEKRLHPQRASSKIVKGLYAEPKNSLDVVFIGSSTVQNAIIPGLLWERYGIPTYNFAVGAHRLRLSYYFLKELLKHQRPKVVAIEMHSVSSDAPLQDETACIMNLNDFNFSVNKILGIWDTLYPQGMFWSRFFTIGRFHSKWKNLNKNMLAPVLTGIYPLKGYLRKYDYRDYGRVDPRNAQSLESSPLSMPVFEDLMKIIELARSKSIPLLFFKTPVHNPSAQKRYNALAEIANKQNIKFFNMNLITNGEIHNNFPKAEECTLLLAEYLIENFPLHSKKNEAGYEHWEESVSFYHRIKLAYSLRHEKKLKNVIDIIGSNSDYLVAVSVRMNNRKNIHPTAVEQLRRLGLNINLKKTFSIPYLAVIETDKNILHESNNRQHSFFWRGVSVAMSSGNRAAVSFEHAGASSNNAGFNLFIYDAMLREIIPLRNVFLDDAM